MTVAPPLIVTELVININKYAYGGSRIDVEASANGAPAVGVAEAYGLPSGYTAEQEAGGPDGRLLHERSLLALHTAALFLQSPPLHQAFSNQLTNSAWTWRRPHQVRPTECRDLLVSTACSLTGLARGTAEQRSTTRKAASGCGCRSASDS